MQPRSAAGARARAVGAQAKAMKELARGRRESALRHSTVAVAAAEEAVAIADQDDDVVLLARTQTCKSEIHEALGDGAEALAAARQALDVYVRLDRETNNPQRVMRRLGPDSVMFMGGHPLKAQFARLYAQTADAQFTLARLIVENQGVAGAAEARRLADVALETYRELVRFDKVYAIRANELAAEHETLTGRLAGGAAAEDPVRVEENERRQLQAKATRAESQAAKARVDYLARRYSDAVENMRTAVELYREVVPHSLWHKRELARALFDFAHHLEAHGSRTPAVDAMDEAGRLFHQVNTQNDRRFAAEVELAARESRRLRRVRLRLSRPRTSVPPLAT
ncbi:hypothetical protein GCM10009804_10960 [Kribbella hippodromi]|uniref:Tetratricopeptide repeat protein n=1 Tax=Kribbella hippodromi TaxID=434347 RepID=A0ABP4N5I1_9ACTN